MTMHPGFATETDIGEAHSDAAVRTGAPSIPDEQRPIEIPLKNLKTGSHDHDQDLNQAPHVSTSVIARSAGAATSSITTDAAQSNNASSPRTTARIQFSSLCFSLFLAGWNDGTIGPLLPRIQQVYKVNFAVVSTIFVAACVGFLVGSLATIYITNRFGFGKILVFGALCQASGYVIQSFAPPFPAFLFSFALAGLGLQLQEAQANSYVASLQRRPEAKMGMLHAAYGIGAFSSPLVSTQFVGFSRWSLFFLASLGLAVANIILQCFVFRFRRQNECLQLAGEFIPERIVELSGTEESTFRSVMRNKAAHSLAVFGLLYVGVEVTIGGWIVTYLINVRGGGSSAGYISSGFWGGITIGRVLLLWVNKKVGSRRVLFIYAILSIGLEFIIWFVPSLIGDAVAVSLIGIFFGPMFPLIMDQATRIIPRFILTGSIGWISGIAQTGSALLPFITGAVAEKHGISSLQPLLIGMMGIMTCLWAIVPNPPRRMD
ncbi:MFS general substrate transporter [Agrocybe pediades]|nr:MFS general substrate transporter [Agrocybe pediades]